MGGRGRPEGTGGTWGGGRERAGGSSLGRVLLQRLSALGLACLHSPGGFLVCDVVLFQLCPLELLDAE